MRESSLSFTSDLITLTNISCVLRRAVTLNQRQRYTVFISIGVNINFMNGVVLLCHDFFASLLIPMPFGFAAIIQCTTPMKMLASSSDDFNVCQL